ncbi:VOC family protein [Natrinema sp. SYSU A 869]|uniref:VOC family protein n=1 Tax=Natrinema sp. SYSU A 869 TaxID=2871694 RepID=UPI001CA46C05|nr:VOC family protein [Natrinema sp. SYSU A 869]
MQKITPNLWFDGDAEAAVDRYTNIFEDATIGDSTRYDAVSAAASGQPEGSVMTVEFELEGQSFIALNGSSQFPFTPAISFVVNCPTTDEVDELWTELSEDGEELMPLDSYPFSDRYGWTNDEFGVSWQLIHADYIPERKIVPSLMFVGERCGQAEEAIEYYTSVFDETEVGNIARYGPDQPPDEEGTIMFADFTLAGQHFAAMDSAREHGFDFNESVSFVVDCADQAEVDYYWDELTADGGEEGQCGWLTDRYGVSWQIVPSVLQELLQDEDAEKVGRVTEEMLQMGKIEISTLEEAHAG